MSVKCSMNYQTFLRGQEVLESCLPIGTLIIKHWGDVVFVWSLIKIDGAILPLCSHTNLKRVAFL